MNSVKKITLALFTALIISLVFSTTVTALGDTDEIPYRSYTYWEDYTSGSKTPVYSKPMYSVENMLNYRDFGAEVNMKITDVVTDENKKIYVLDSENSLVYVLNANYTPAETVRSFVYNDESVSFKNAGGIFVKNGLIYIADAENSRVIISDSTGKIEKFLTLPDSELIPSDFVYKPVKVAVDSKGYTYVLSLGSYYGAILYSPEMEFLGFFGANSVKKTTLDTVTSLWKRITSNDAKRAADELVLPYSFTDIVLGADDFVYTATGKSDDAKIQSGQLCIFNPGGKNITSAADKNFADYAVGSYQFTSLTQNLGNLDVDEDGFIYLLDSTYGRIFWYDSSFNLISVFGGSVGVSNQMGTFSLAGAIAVNGTDVLVTDSQKNTLTIFKINEYGNEVRNAQKITLSGDFKAAKESWLTLSSKDSNCQLAYRGLAKAYYDEGNNKLAIKYAKLGFDRDTYSKAFAQIRTEIIEKYYTIIFVSVVILAAVLIFIKIKFRGKTIKLKSDTKLHTAVISVSHPSECFRLVKEKHLGSVIISSIILAAFYIVTVLNDTAGGFAFTVFDFEKYNAFYVLLSTVGLVILWTATNWLVCTLLGGIGKLSEIYTVTCYSLIPLLFGRTVKLLLTHILTPDEGAFLNVFTAACIIYTAFMLIIGMMRIHDYEFGKFVGTAVLTVLAMIVVVFLIFLIFMLVQQVITWFGTVFVEIRYR